jgi:hypothetical protein
MCVKSASCEGPPLRRVFRLSPLEQLSTYRGRNEGGDELSAQSAGDSSSRSFRAAALVGPPSAFKVQAARWKLVGRVCPPPARVLSV